MNLQDLGKTVAKFAPVLGTALGGPAGMAIGAGIAQLFGADPNNTDDLIRRITTDPQSAIKLKELENDLAIEMRNLDVDEYKVEVDDRKSARETKDNTTRNIAYIITIAFIASVFCIFFLKNEIDTNEKELAALLLGMLCNEFKTVTRFLFGGYYNK